MMMVITIMMVMIMAMTMSKSSSVCSTNLFRYRYNNMVLLGLLLYLIISSGGNDGMHALMMRCQHTYEIVTAKQYRLHS